MSSPPTAEYVARERHKAVFWFHNRPGLLRGWQRYAELVYNGQWFHPLREALQRFVDHTNATVTGTAKVRLFKGRAQAVSATSPHSLYDPQLASFSMAGYDVTAARGFIDLFGLPMKVASQRRRW